ncbi:toll/interleukin-1 receptor domain-containing protein [Streptomyces sp. XY006]|uniref:toll/interleukin-1 receptor domain-containing protein n=1 Tax=Streptomyces sp. XY006 TaxID=2021410 RepID=UPI0015C669A1|nr:toll/interleukin-1 receptor domain-containing protein [Streptomyces sp. XY006]
MANDFITSFAAVENRAYAARFHQDLVQAVARRKGRAVSAAMCRGGGEANRPLVAETKVFVALCSPAYYNDHGCGADWAVFQHRLHLVPSRFRAEPTARVLVRWQPAQPPLHLPLAPVLSGEITDSYACQGIYGIIREEGPRSAVYQDAVGKIADAVCGAHECSPPTVSLGEVPDLALPFPRRAGDARTDDGSPAPRASVPQPRKATEDTQRPCVFLSYAHEEDGDVHKGRVAALGGRLRSEGIGVLLDTDAHRKGPQHWGRWMRKQYNEADFVVVIVSPAYKRRAEHEEEPGKGDGVGYEADFILDERMTDRQWYERILLVSFPEHGRACIPDFLKGVTLYTLDPETGEGDLPDLVDYIKSKAP